MVRSLRSWSLPLLLVVPCATAACGDNGADPDAGDPAADATAGPDAIVLDASPDAMATLPLAGFGDLTGMCDLLDEPDLIGTAPELFSVDLSFPRRYVDPDDRPLLTPGGLEMILVGNAGGSSVYSEVFAYEVLARCDLASLLKTETEIVYDVDGKKTDMLVEVDGHKIGVSVTRAVTFPFGDPYTLDAATTLIQRKLDDILLSSAEVSAADHWDKQILAILAYDDQHAQVAAEAWAALDDATRADTIVIIIPTGGDDLFIYTDQ
ncbi:MAG: hypothetical protein H6708_34055 [Kofleriaceae bacterium]|nr:hypothetical protein [Kofleriaceae bacterium]